MDGSILVAAQLSSLYTPAQAHHIHVPSVKATDLSFPTDPNFPAEHAVNSTALYSEQTGTVLLRVLHEGLILELISLSLDIPPIRFVLQSPVLSSPGIFLWEDKEIHIIALTNAGSLHRLVVPLRESQDLWKAQLANIWTREYIVKSFPDDARGVVFVHGVYCVTVGTANGLLRFDTEYSGAHSPEGVSTLLSYTCLSDRDTS